VQAGDGEFFAELRRIFSELHSRELGSHSMRKTRVYRGFK
jgi:hypothetical protein